MFGQTVENVLIERGILGVAVLVLGWFAMYMFRRMVTELDAYRKKNDEMVQTLLEVIPLIKRSTEIHELRHRDAEDIHRRLGEVVDVMKDVQRELARR